MHDAASVPDSVQHLADLGYVDPLLKETRQQTERQQSAARLNEALAQLASGDPAGGLDTLEDLIERDPDWPAPRVALAEALLRTGQVVAAGHQLEELLYRGVENARTARLTAEVAAHQRHFSRALRELEFARALDDSEAEIHALLGRIYLRRGMLEESAGAVRRALARDPHHKDAMLCRAQIALRRDDPAFAATCALDALARDISRAEGHYYLGLALRRLGRGAEALQAFEVCASRNPGLAAPYRHMGYICAEQLRDPVRATEYRQRGKQIVRSRR